MKPRCDIVVVTDIKEHLRTAIQKENSAWALLCRETQGRVYGQKLLRTCRQRCYI